jgi:hypothetical protein
MLGAAPDPLSAGARVLHGVYTSSDEYMRSLLVRGDEAAIPDRPGDDASGTEGQEPGQ